MEKSINTPAQSCLKALLKNCRHELSLTQVELAERLGRPQSFVSKYETGERRLDLPELREVCAALEITLVDFVKRFEKELAGKP